MRLFIPAHIQTAIKHAPEGSTVLGTFSALHGVATVTELLTNPASSASAHPFDTPETAQQNVTRQTLAVVGRNEGIHPLRVSCNGMVTWSDHAGRPLATSVGPQLSRLGSRRASRPPGRSHSPSATRPQVKWPRRA